jgi:hypothetical protein
MDCQLCANLERALKARQNEFALAASLACHRVSTKFAAYIYVEMQRAKSELEEHRSICVFAGNLSAPLPQAALRKRSQRKGLRDDPIETAA